MQESDSTQYYYLLNHFHVTIHPHPPSVEPNIPLPVFLHCTETRVSTKKEKITFAGFSLVFCTTGKGVLETVKNFAEFRPFFNYGYTDCKLNFCATSVNIVLQYLSFYFSNF